MADKDQKLSKISNPNKSTPQKEELTPQNQFGTTLQSMEINNESLENPIDPLQPSNPANSQSAELNAFKKNDRKPQPLSGKHTAPIQQKTTPKTQEDVNPEDGYQQPPSDDPPPEDPEDDPEDNEESPEDTESQNDSNEGGGSTDPKANPQDNDQSTEGGKKQTSQQETLENSTQEANAQAEQITAQNATRAPLAPPKNALRNIDFSSLRLGPSTKPVIGIANKNVAPLLGGAKQVDESESQVAFVTPAQTFEGLHKKSPQGISLAPSKLSENLAQEAKQHATQRLSSFEAALDTKAEQIEAQKSGIAEKAAQARQAAEAQLQQQLEQRQQELSGLFSQASSNFKGLINSARADVAQGYADSTDRIRSAAQQARNELDQTRAKQKKAHQSAQAGIDGLIAQHITNAIQGAQEAAKEAADAARKKGGAAATAYDAQPLPDASRWQKIKNGGNYEKNKRSARVKAAQDTGNAYAETFLQRAQDVTAKIEESKAEFTEEFSNLAKKGESDLAGLHSASLTQIDRVEASALNAAKQHRNATLQAIRKMETQGLGDLAKLHTTQESALTEHEARSRAQLADLEAQSTQVLTASLDDALLNIEQLRAQMQQLVAEQDFSSQKEVDLLFDRSEDNLSALGQSLDAAEVEGFQGLKQNFDQALEQANTGFSELISNASENISGLHGQHSTALGELQSSFTKGLSDLELKQTENNGQTLQTADQEMAKVTEGFTEVRDEFLKELSAYGSTSTQNLKDEFTKELSELDAKIEAEAEAAAKKVQPNWKKVVAGAIKVAIAVAVSAAIGALIASGAGIGVIIVAAIAIGVVGGLLKHAVDVGFGLEDGKDWRGWVSAGVTGAIDGLISAATAGLGDKLSLPVETLKQRITKAAIELAATLPIDVVGATISSTIEHWIKGEETSVKLFFQELAANAIEGVAAGVTGKVFGLIGPSKKLSELAVFKDKSPSPYVKGLLENTGGDILEGLTSETVKSTPLKDKSLDWLSKDNSAPQTTTSGNVNLTKTP